MTWARKRQIFYASVVILFFGTFGSLIYYSNSKTAPTCTDGLKNGTETGVDCGGSCVRACAFEADTVSILWARSFMVVPGRYNAVAYLENHNENLAVNKIRYSFRFGDENNIYLGRREGVAYIPAGRAFAIFERGITLGNSTPVYTSFEFTEDPDWVTVPDNKVDQLQVIVSEVNLENPDGSPHLTAVISNPSLIDILNLSVAVILYDEHRNAISASATVIEKLRGEERKMIDFTWPMPFVGKVVTMEVLPSFNIFGVK